MGRPKGSSKTPGSGRQPGSRNKSTLEKAEAAERKLLAAQRPGARKLAKDELEDIAFICKSAAAYFQPTIVTPEMEAAAAASGQPIKTNPHGDWDKFAHWLVLSRDTFEAYAKYQSPQLRAIAIATPVGAEAEAEQIGSYAARDRLEQKIMRRILAEEIELQAAEIVTESPRAKDAA